MQKDINKEFDLYVKETMGSAQAAPSPRVWQAISARLAAGAAPEGAVAPAASAGVSGSRSFQWGWVALAAAAAVAAILVIPGNSNLSTINEHEVLAQASVVEVGEIPAPAALKAVPAKVSSAAAGAGRQEAKPVAEPEPRQKEAKTSDPLEKNEGGPSKSAENAGASVSESVVEPANEPIAEPTVQPNAEPEADPFAAMAYEDTRKAARKTVSSLWLGGAVGGNEAGSGRTVYAAKSSNPNYIENSIVENSASNYGIPVSLGAGVKFGFTERLSASAGVDYSFLSRSFNGTYTPSGSAPTIGEISHEMRYIGLPVGVYYNLIAKGNVGFYLFGLGEAEWCLGNSYNIAGTVVSEKVSGTQFSAGGGFGVEFRLSPTLSLYADPAVRYYFDCGHPNNIRSEKQLMLNFNAGLRFNL